MAMTPPVWWLCGQGLLDMVRAALARGEDVNSKSGSNSTGLIEAVMNDQHNSRETNNALVRLLLEQSTVDLNCIETCMSLTALHWAAYWDNAEVVRLLLADTRLNTANCKDKNGNTPVMLAMIYNKVNALRELVAHPSVQLDTKDGMGWSLQCVARDKEYVEAGKIVAEATERRMRQVEMEELQKKHKELVQRVIRENKERLENVKRESKKAEETLQILQVSREVEELRRKQEELVQEAIEGNKDIQLRVERKNEEMVEEMRKENEEKVEEMRRAEMEMELKQRKENKEAEEKLCIENRTKEENLKWGNKEKEEQLKKEHLAKEAKQEKENERALDLLQIENKAMEERLKQENEETLTLLMKKNKEMDDCVMKEIEEAEKLVRRENKENEEKQRRKQEESLATLISENETRMKEMLENEEKRTARKRKAEVSTKKQPAAPECPVCFDEMGPPTKIFQCGSGGHLVCENCKLQLEPVVCPICRKRITGRATGLENFLKELLPTGQA